MMRQIGRRVFTRFWSSLFIVLMLYSVPLHAQERTCPRVVSQVPSMSQIIEWLGAGHCLVGVSRYDARTDLPRTGGIVDPDYAAIAALRPDIVFLVPASAPEPPELAPTIRFVRWPAQRSVDEISALAYEIAQHLGQPDAQAKRDRLRALFDEKLAGLAAANRFRGNVAVLTNCVRGAALIGHDTFIADALRRAGFSFAPAPGQLLKGSEDEIIAQLQEYWDKHQITGLVVLSDRIRPLCVRSAQARRMPIYPVGDSRMSFPSPVLLADLDHLMDVVSRTRGGGLAEGVR